MPISVSARDYSLWPPEEFSFWQYSGTPPYDHPVFKSTSLLRPYSSKPNVENIDSFYYFEDPVNATTSLLRPGFYGPTVVVLTGFHCIINPLLAKLVCSRCLNIVFSPFFTLLLTSTSSRSIKKKSNKQTPTPTYYTQRTWRILSHLDQTCVSLYTLVKIGTRKVNSGTKKIIIDI